MINNSDFLFGFFDNLLFLEACLELTHILDYGTAVHAHIRNGCAGIVCGTALLSRRRPSLWRAKISSLHFVQKPLVSLRDWYQRGIVLAYLQIRESRKLALCSVLSCSICSMTTRINWSHILSYTLPLLMIGGVRSVLHRSLPLNNLVLCILGKINTAYSSSSMLRKATKMRLLVGVHIVLGWIVILFSYLRQIICLCLSSTCC